MRSSLPRRFGEGAYPALLKVYFEHISVVGIVNRYTDHGPVGMCRASKLHYVTTRGGFATDEQDLGWQNVKGLAKVYGIEHADCISVNATDVPTTDVDAAVATAIAGIPQLIGEQGQPECGWRLFWTPVADASAQRVCLRIGCLSARCLRLGSLECVSGAWGFYCGFCPGCGMGIDMLLLKLYFLLRLRFVPAALLKPLCRNAGGRACA